MKIKIITFISYFLPGYKAGGPLRSIVNLVNHLNDEFEFWIVTRDRDLGDSSPYNGVLQNQWQSVAGAMVYYLPPEDVTIKNMAKIINSTPHDILYLNSFFAFDFTIKPLLARRLKLLLNKPVILAPRGEFSSGAIKIKKFKKTFFIRFSKILKLYSGVVWQASSEHEAQDLINILKVSRSSIFISLNLPARMKISNLERVYARSTPLSSNLRIVFLSRISPKKNLDYALMVLRKVRVNVVFDIYGPSEDEEYFAICKNLIKQLPVNIVVNIFGSAHPDQVLSIFNNYDLFFFPTRGENYGHVIAEALSVGTPVLLSDQTPWRNLKDDGLGWDLPLYEEAKFVEVIEEYSRVDKNEKEHKRKNIKEKIFYRLSDSQVLEDNRNLFKSVTLNS
ncbi:hypothetical protein JCM30471_00660 [Desulfuromonas carbonis]|uniref:glycosyltransferase family 4 protein n=1 Tax=Desulfuromonas sp. DDH964 TaxID=1823759 RepID=UPI00078D8644|nr:glycosyltransferase family 4 protein [Desulfuromonas sp. DDH964]AMV71875.1 Glycosyltransferase Gtf1 [Desulfuromonas sp. DDH964]